MLFVIPPDEFNGPDAVEFSDIDAAVGAANLLEGEGVSVTRAVDEGIVSEQIARSAAESKADEIVMGGRKRSGLQEVLMGSFTQEVMLSAERPVTITGWACRTASHHESRSAFARSRGAVSNVSARTVRRANR